MPNHPEKMVNIASEKKITIEEMDMQEAVIDPAAQTFFVRYAGDIKRRPSMAGKGGDV